MIHIYHLLPISTILLIEIRQGDALKVVAFTGNGRIYSDPAVGITVLTEPLINL